MQQLGIYGAGGFGREVAWLASALGYEVISYVDDGLGGQSISGIPVVPLPRFRAAYPEALIVIAIGSPASRKTVASQCGNFATLIDVAAKMSPSVRVGAGSIICAGSILTVDIELGCHVHINLDCTVGHDARIGDFSTLAPGVHISGNVHIGSGVYIGTGAVVINGTSDQPLVIGDGAVIGAGACVTTHVEPRTLYAGVPAILKKRY